MIKTPIIYDTDCLSSFIIIDKMDILKELFDHIIIPRQVFKEFKQKKDRSFDKTLQKHVKSNFIIAKEIEVKTPESETYKQIKSGLFSKKCPGRGESAALTLAITYNGTLASNNTRDVIEIVDKFNINWITTGDILIEAYHKKIITEEEGNIIWKNMLYNGRYLTTETFTEYLNNSKKHPPNYIQ